MQKKWINSNKSIVLWQYCDSSILYHKIPLACQHFNSRIAMDRLFTVECCKHLQPKAIVIVWGYESAETRLLDTEQIGSANGKICPDHSSMIGLNYWLVYWSFDEVWFLIWSY